MLAHEFDSLLMQLRRACTSAEKARLSRRIKAAQRERWFNRPHAEAVQRLAREVGVRVEAWQPAPLDVGASWVLLYGNGEGHVAPLTVHAQPAQRVPPELRYELDRALAGLQATVGRLRLHLPCPLHATQVEVAAERVVGASLGVAVCVGWMSRALGVPASASVVASAQVSPTGALEPVEHLAPKLAALREHLPHVETVVVAAAQHEPANTHGFELVRCDQLAEALEAFGLSPSMLTADRSAERYERDYDELKRLEAASFSSEQWLASARRAQEVALGLTTFHDEELGEKAAQSFILGALFALHGGDPVFAEVLLCQISTDTLPPELVALAAVVQASRAIDVRGSGCIAEARAAVNLAESLSSPREKREVLGRAYGTLGRALMHRDAFDDALPWLQQGAAFHQERAPREHARSLCYVAQCLRGLGRADDALEATRTALALCETVLGTAEKTKAYLRLEEGRALLALGKPSCALDAFDSVIDRQGEDADYPRVSALRGKAAALHALGQVDAAASWFDRCRAVAQASDVAPMLREVASLAIGDVLVREGDNAAPALWKLWSSFWPDYVQNARLLWRVRSFVY